MNYKLTDEQNNILDKIRLKDVVSVNAYPGTGKTFTLVKVAEDNPYSKILYLAFNKHSVDEAKLKLPSNVTVMTTHSLAYEGTKSLHKGNVRGDVSISEVVSLLNLNYTEAELVLETFNKFLASNYNDINVEIVSSLLDDVSKFVMSINKLDIERLTTLVKQLFKLIYNGMLNGFPHSFYLKYFQLKKNKIKKFDMLLVDEAQDTNDVTFSIIDKIEAKKVIVGDTHQQIYRNLRYSSLNLSSVSNEVNYLTKSFRLKQSSAEYAYNFIKLFKNEQHPIVGISSESSTKNKAFISRTNSTLIEEFDRRIKDDVTFIRDPRLIFSTAIDVMYFIEKYRDKITNPLLRSLNNLKDLEELRSFDREIDKAYNIAEQYGLRLLDLRSEAIRKFNAKKSKEVLTTAHSVKGLEFDEVTIGNDFPDIISEIASLKINNLNDFYKNSDSKLIDEINTYFVAVTRSRNVLNNINLDYELSLNEINNRLSINHDIREALKNK